MKFNTKTIHGGQEHDPAYGAVMPPIYQTSTYAQSTPGAHLTSDAINKYGAHNRN